MNNIEEKNIVYKSLDDFLDGLKKTFIETPMDFGGFLARVSGYRDYQLGNISVMDLEKPEQKQSILELRAIWESITFDNLKIVGKAIWEDIQERPAYYVGSMLSGIGISKTIKMDTIIDTYLLKGIYGISSTGTRADIVVNKNFENIKDILKMSDYEFNKYVENTINNIDTLKTDENSILRYIKEAGLKKQLSEQEIKDEVYKSLREYVHENGITSFQDIGQFMEKVREELKNGTIKIENQQQDKEQNLKEIQEEPKEENYNFQVYRR